MQHTLLLFLFYSNAPSSLSSYLGMSCVMNSLYYIQLNCISFYLATSSLPPSLHLLTGHPHPLTPHQHTKPVIYFISISCTYNICMNTFLAYVNNCLGRVVLCSFVFLLCCVALPFFLSISWMIKSCNFSLLLWGELCCVALPFCCVVLPCLVFLSISWSD